MNYSLNFYVRMQRAFAQAVRFAPQSVAAEMDELSALIASFAPPRRGWLGAVG